MDSTHSASELADVDDVVMNNDDDGESLDTATAPTTATGQRLVAPPPPPNANLKIPDENVIKNAMLMRACRGRKAGVPQPWRVVPPHKVYEVLGFSAPSPTTTTTTASTTPQPMETESNGDEAVVPTMPTPLVTSSSEDRQRATTVAPTDNVLEETKKSLSYMRRYVYAETKKRLAVLARGLVRQGLPGLEQRTQEAEAVVERLASELAAWAVFGDTPPSLLEARAAFHAAKPETAGPGAETMPPLLAGRRERDAITLLKSQQGRGDDAPLPSSNSVISDAHEAQQPDPSSKAKHERPLTSVITALAQAITGRDPRTGEPRQGAQIMERARQLAINDGVFLIHSSGGGGGDASDETVKRVILVRASEVESMLRAPTDSLDREMADTRAVLDAWRQARVETEDERLGLERHSIVPGYSSSSSSSSGGGGEGDVLDYAKITGAMFRCPPQGDKSLGYDFGTKRVSYYRPEALGRSNVYGTVQLPSRACVPLLRGLLTTFIYQHYVAFANASRWYLMPDVVMPTCPAMNLLIDGVSPFHMGVYSILEDYLVLLRTAVDRFSTPGVSPPSNVINEQGGACTAADFERARNTVEAVKRRGALLCQLTNLNNLGTAYHQRPVDATTVDDSGYLDDDWLNWFVPEAVLPIPRDKAELDSLYPADDTAMHPWLRELVANTNLRGASYRKRLEAFDLLCKEQDRRVALQNKRKTKANKKKHARKQQQQQQQPSTTKDSELPDYMQETIDKELKPDTSLAGRAETILGLTGIWMLMCFQRLFLLQYNEKLEHLRSEYGPGVDCGNGYNHVRKAEYYDKLFTVCLQHAAHTLEVHELILILINARWVDASKAIHHRIPIQIRLQPEYVARAHPDVVERTLQRRQQNLAERLELDPSKAPLAKGFARFPTPEGTFADASASSNTANSGESTPPPPTSKGEGEDWTTRKLVSHRVRPDCPTYAQMILFDHLTEGIDTGSETARQDANMDELNRRMHAMAIRDARLASENPEQALVHHELPGNAPRKAATKRSGKETHSSSSSGSDNSNNNKNKSASKRRRPR